MDAPFPSSPSPGSWPIPPGACCVRHPLAPATQRCADCRALLCATCAGALPDGGYCCATCLENRAQATVAEVFAAPGAATKLKLRDRSGDRTMASVVPVTVAPVLALGREPRCAHHAAAAAIASCDTCQGLMCATCMFEVPGGLHLCPGCAMTARNPLSSGRKWSVIISLVIAVFSLAGFVVTMLGLPAGLADSEGGAVAIGLLVVLVWFLLPVAGVALSFGAMDKKLGNPPVIWVAGILNLLLVASFLVMSSLPDTM